jgi:hypothetical protein
VIEINVTEAHLKSRTFEINLGQRDIMKKLDCPGKNRTNGNPILKVTYTENSLWDSSVFEVTMMNLWHVT